MVSLITATPPNGAPHITLRLRYRKTGALAYISHLDVLRTFTKALLRAGLPLYYSEGFSPHPKLTFAAPLPVGQESECEYLDVRLAAPFAPQDAMRALNEALPSGLRVTTAGYPALPFSAVDRARYGITLRTTGADDALAARVCDILSAQPLTVFKRSKAGDRDVDVSPNILAVAAEAEDGVLTLSLTLRAVAGAFLNIEYLMALLRRDAGVLSGDPLRESCRIVRLALENENGEPFCEEELL